MIEEWKIYRDTRYNPHGSLYEISNYGNVRKNGIIITPKIGGKYLFCGINRIHRMVAEAFIPNPDNKPCIDHIDCNTLNNRVDNLKWVTYKENMGNPITKITHKNNQPNRNSINNPMYGKHHSEESKKKMSLAAYNRYK